MDIRLGDFKPINDWKVDADGEKWSWGLERFEEPKFVIDQTTGRRYMNDLKGEVRFRCALFALGTPLVHLVASVANVAYRVFKVVTFSHFRNSELEGLKPRFVETGKDLLRVIAQPIALVGLELAALHGLLRPYDGRKLYASIERAQYGRAILAPGFQPVLETPFLRRDLV